MWIDGGSAHTGCESLGAPATHSNEEKTTKRRSTKESRRWKEREKEDVEFHDKSIRLIGVIEVI